MAFGTGIAGSLLTITLPAALATTTIVGLTPMIFIGGDAQGGFDYKNMAIVVASGLLLGTFLTPFVVSLGYTLVDDGWMSVRNVLWRARITEQRDTDARRDLRSGGDRRGSGRDDGLPAGGAER